MDKIYNQIDLTLSIVQTAISSIQTHSQILSIILAFFGVTGVIVAWWFEKNLKKTKISLEQLTENNSHAMQKLEEVNNLYKEIEKKHNNMEDDLSKMNEEKNSLKQEIVIMEARAEALHSAFMLKDRNLKTRQEHLQRLSQLVHPVGIQPMIGILKDTTAEIETRMESAYGLGRYSENDDLKIFWSEIVTALIQVLENETDHESLLIETILSVSRYKDAAVGIIPKLIDCSRSHIESIRRSTAEAFRDLDVYDHAAIQRLEEMNVSDKSQAVQKAASSALEKLKKKRIDI
jgi:chromosome segregation ATPase